MIDNEVVHKALDSTGKQKRSDTQVIVIDDDGNDKDIDNCNTSGAE